MVLHPLPEKVIKFKDADVGAQYVEFPPDTLFMEGLAFNEAYRQGVAYVPVQRVVVSGRKQSHLYRIDFNPSSISTSTEAEQQFQLQHVCGPLATKDGNTAVSVFGSALSSDGMLYLCVFNRNSVIGINLKAIEELEQQSSSSSDKSDKDKITRAELEIPVPAPNDVAIDPENDSVLYVAGGEMDSTGRMSLSAYGAVSKVTIDNHTHKRVDVAVVKSDLTVLAGIEVINDKIVVAELQDILTINRWAPHDVTKIWDGNDGKGNCWMADNVCVMVHDNNNNNNDRNNNFYLCPAYNVIPYAATHLLRLNCLNCFVSFLVQLSSAACLERPTYHNNNGDGGGDGEKKSWAEALYDPEVDLSLSNTYVDPKKDPMPVRFMAGSVTDPDLGYHFEVDLADTRAKHEPWEVRDMFPGPNHGAVLGERYYFDEQVTHMSHLVTSSQGYLVCINFQQPRILIMKDDKFLEAMK